LTNYYEFVLSEIVILDLHRATHRVGLFLERARLGVTQGEAHLLAHLHRSGASSVAQLHAAFAHKRSTLTSFLDRLEKQGLITREVRPSDRRSFLVRLTPAGVKQAAAVDKAITACERAVQARVGKRDLEGYMAVLAALEEATK
jgi:DNA-binding MarR family transcriptional regulator